jgi:DNA repair exonuclease SbcCD ATPase subunit
MSSSYPQASSSSEVPFTSSDIHNLSMVVNIHQSLGRLTEAVSNLKDDTKSNHEKIEQLVQWTITIPNIEREVAQNSKDLRELRAQHSKDLNELGRRLEKDVNALGGRHDKDIKELEKIAHTASTFGQIAIVLIGSSVVLAIAILTFLYHHLVFK